MTAQIHCLHTSQKDVAIYNGLFAATGADVRLTHAVRPDLLGAQRGAVAEAMISDADVVLCTCTTLAPMVGLHPKHVDVVTPAMQRACAIGPDVLVVGYKPAALHIAGQALEKAAAKAGVVAFKRSLVVDPQNGPLAQALRDEIRLNGLPDCIVLAQASLRTFAPDLASLGCPVLTTPETAVEAAIARAGGVRGMVLL